MGFPKARIKLVTTEDGRVWCLAGWVEAYSAERGGTVYLTLQDGAEIIQETITSLEFNQYYPLWPTYEFSAEQEASEAEPSRNGLNPAGHRYERTW